MKKKDLRIYLALSLLTAMFFGVGFGCALHWFHLPSYTTIGVSFFVLAWIINQINYRRYNSKYQALLKSLEK